ncbi:hypothetical protein STXM2123_4069 [Streptomyces sp. F-3]|nr:hypothetical protein STXM2123_4069 [Streptomyces sp. F-3]
MASLWSRRRAWVPRVRAPYERIAARGPCAAHGLRHLFGARKGQ